MCVHGKTGTDNLSIPDEFEKHSKLLFKKDHISEREFIDFCLLAIDFTNSHWVNRQGMAYQVVGAWLKYENIDQDNLLHQIGTEFSSMELPDHFISSSEQGVRNKWSELKILIDKADSKFPKSTLKMEAAE